MAMMNPGGFDLLIRVFVSGRWVEFVGILSGTFLNISHRMYREKKKKDKIKICFFFTDNVLLSTCIARPHLCRCFTSFK